MNMTIMTAKMTVLLVLLLLSMTITLSVTMTVPMPMTSTEARLDYYTTTILLQLGSSYIFVICDALMLQHFPQQYVLEATEQIMYPLAGSEVL